MKCDQVKLELPGFMFGELSEADQNEVSKHLKKCTTCSSELDDLKIAQKILKSVPLRPVNPLQAVAEPNTAEVKNISPILIWTAKWFIAASIVGFALLLIKPELSVSSNGFSFQAGNIKTSNSAELPQNFQTALEQNRMETLLMVNQILTQNSENQRKDYFLTMAALTRDLGEQRRNDLEWIESGLNEVQRNSHESVLRTSLILDDLIKNTNFPTGGE